jgi:hypothetical protein
MIVVTVQTLFILLVMPLCGPGVWYLEGRKKNR